MTRISNRNGARLGRALSRLLAAILELVAAAGALAILTAWTCGLLLVATIVTPSAWAVSRVGRLLRSESLAARFVVAAVAGVMAAGAPILVMMEEESWPIAALLFLGSMLLMIRRGRRGGHVLGRKPALPEGLGDFA